MRRTTRAAGCLCAGAILGAFLCYAPAGAAPRFRVTGRLSGDVVEWVTTDGERVGFGADRRVLLGRPGPAGAFRVELELSLQVAVADAALCGPRLFLAGRDEGLQLVDLAAPEPRPEVVELDPPSRGRLHLACSGRYLILAEEGYGLRFLELPRAHDHAGAGARATGRRLQTAGLLPLPGPIAVAAAGRRVYVAIAGGGLAEIDARDPRNPSLLRIVPRHASLEALAVNGSNVYGAGLDGLHVRSLASAEPAEVDARIRGHSLDLAGRTIYVAAGDEGLLTVRDAATGAQVHPVIVGNNFFSPVSLTIDVGDIVQWTNGSGNHNVYSCIPEQFGCDGKQANETFVSGPPADPIWIYSYTFREPGSNPYLCQSHAEEMAGLVSVTAPVVPPPPVPDGGNGAPMTVAKLDPAGSSLTVSWDTAACPGAVDYQILFGAGTSLPLTLGDTYELGGAECAIGTVSPFVWSPAPRIPDSSQLVWFLIVATNGGSREGSWGTDSQGTERSGPAAGGASGKCGIAVKDLTNTCDP